MILKECYIDECLLNRSVSERIKHIFRLSIGLLHLLLLNTASVLSTLIISFLS